MTDVLDDVRDHYRATGLTERLKSDQRQSTDHQVNNAARRIADPRHPGERLN